MPQILGTLVLFLCPLIVRDPELLHHFDYDQKAPLDVQELGVEHRGSVTIHNISYASPKGGRVPAFLVVPSGSGPFAGVIWGHWYQEGSPLLNRKEFLEEAVVLASSGVVSLLTDGPIARPGYAPDPDPLGEAQINIEFSRLSTCDVALICFLPVRTSILSGSPMWDTATMRQRVRFSPESIDASRSLSSWLANCQMRWI